MTDIGKRVGHLVWVWRSILPWWAQDWGTTRERGREGGEGGEGGAVRSSGWAAWLVGNTELCVGPGWPSHTSASPHNLHGQKERHRQQHTHLKDLSHTCVVADILLSWYKRFYRTYIRVVCCCSGALKETLKTLDILKNCIFFLLLSVWSFSFSFTICFSNWQNIWTLCVSILFYAPLLLMLLWGVWSEWGLPKKASQIIFSVNVSV